MKESHNINDEDLEKISGGSKGEVPPYVQVSGYCDKHKLSWGISSPRANKNCGCPSCEGRLERKYI